MDKERLYPELADYIFNYCGKYFWQDEVNANRQLHALAQSNNGVNIAMYKFYLKDHSEKQNEAVRELIKDGFDAFKYRVSRRIWHEHKDELDLNLCPACGKIARTPQAKQCRFCYHDWH